MNYYGNAALEKNSSFAASNFETVTIKEWTAANAGKKKKKKNPIAKLYGILKGKIMYSENAFSTTCTPA